LAAQAQSTAIQLNWADNETSETDFRILRKAIPGGTFAPLTTVTANTTSYLDQQVVPNQSYAYQIVALNGAATLSTSNEAAAQIVDDENGLCEPDDINVTGVVSTNALHRTVGTITSDAQITAPTAVLFKAATAIVLEPGFQADAGSDFTARIEDCEPNDCCPDDPLLELEWLAPFIGDDNYSIEQCKWNGACIYVIRDFCVVSDGTTTYYDCQGNVICERANFLDTCIPGFAPTDCVMLKPCSAGINSGDTSLAKETDKLNGSDRATISAQPNPFSSETEIVINLPETRTAKLSVIDTHGKVVFQEERQYPKGVTMVSFSGRNLPSGVYFYQLASAQGILSKSLVLLKDN